MGGPGLSLPVHLRMFSVSSISPPLPSFHETRNVKAVFSAFSASPESLLKPEIVFFAASSAGMEPSIGGGQA